MTRLRGRGCAGEPDDRELGRRCKSHITSTNRNQGQPCQTSTRWISWRPSARACSCSSPTSVRFANRSFCKTFGGAPEDTIGRKLYELGDGIWDIPKLRHVLEAVIPEHATIEAFEVDRVFPLIGRRVMLLNAR